MSRVSFKVRVQHTGHTYLPKEVVNGGFTGDLEGLPNSCTFLLIKPGTTTEEVVRSLKLHLQHMQMEKI